MAKTGRIYARIDEKDKIKVSKILAKQGLTISDAIYFILAYVNTYGCLPPVNEKDYK